MASTYVNNLRLNEMATGDASGSWGTNTNSNLELIGEALGSGTEAIGDANTTITMADGSADGVRSLYLKITSSTNLTATRTITLAPDTVSKVWIIDNSTGGSQSIIIKQGSGSGAAVTIPTGASKVVATDGNGSGAIVSDCLTDIDFSSISLAGTTVTSTAAELNRLDITTLGTSQASKAVTADASGDILIPDSDKLKFGAGSDLEIFHDGSNSIIRDNGTGALFLEGDTVSIRDEASSETMANFVSDGAVTLYHNNAVKLATASGGIAVTGEVAATSLDISGDVDIDGTLETDALSIASTTVTSTAAELNILDGVTSTAAELNILDGVTSTAAELNILDGVTSTAAELNLVDGITAGTVAASKAVIVDSNKDITGYRNLTSTGTITGAEVTATSDIRLKSNIETIDSALDKVKEMRGVYFDKHGSQDKRSVGVIAQEMQEIMPEVVVTDDTEDKYLSVAYGNLVGVLIEAVKELSEEVDKLKKSIRTVEFKDSK